MSALARWLLGPGAVAATAAVMLAWTWRTWPDTLVDFGRELYVPWQLAQGRVLYADIAHFNGPLSAYWNAAWFRLLGPSLSALVAVNLGLLAALIAVLHALLAHVGGRFAAAVAGVVFAALFAFAPFGIGNYNWVCPYSHELTHGILLALAALYALLCYHRRGRARALAGAGLALGLLALTKVEVVAAGGVAILAGLALTLRVERPGAGRLARLLAAFAGAAAAPALAVLLAFAPAMPLARVLREPLGYWAWLLRRDLPAMAFFRAGMGLDEPGASARALLAAAAGWGLVFGAAALASLAAGRLRRGRAAVAAGAFAAVLLGLGARWTVIDWPGVFRPLPLLLALLAAGGLWRWRRPADLRAASRGILAACLLLFALGLLAKMALNARIYHYGFALAMPATLVLVVALLAWVPAALERAGGHGGTFRAAAVAALAVGLFAYLQLAAALLDQKAYPVGDGPDRFRGDARAPVLEAAIRELRARSAPHATLAVFPEGVMLNYLLRRPNPTPYLFFGPFDLALFGEERMVGALAASPPDDVVLVHKDTAEYGASAFGRDYGHQVAAWIGDNYRTVAVLGAPPFAGRGFGIALMTRR